MFRARCYLKSTSPVSFSRKFDEPKLEGESDSEHEKRTWREKVHTNTEGEVIIPGIMFKKSLAALAKLLGERIPKMKGSTYTSRFQADVLVENDIPLGIKKKDLQYEDQYVPSDGRPGGSSRVLKTFPIIPNWEGWITVTVVLDKIITKQVFEKYLKLAGQLSGIGRFRPAKGGNKGRWNVEKIEYEEIKG